MFQRLVDRFPEGAVRRRRALYHVGLCKARLGDMPGAIAAVAGDADGAIPGYALGEVRGRAAWRSSRRR